MNLKTYVNELPNLASKKEFAKRIGTTWGYLQHVLSGRKSVSAQLAIEIERESAGAVKCESLRPQADWGYIRNTGRLTSNSCD